MLGSHFIEEYITVVWVVPNQLLGCVLISMTTT